MSEQIHSFLFHQVALVETKQVHAKRQAVTYHHLSDISRGRGEIQQLIFCTNKKAEIA